MQNLLIVASEQATEQTVSPSLLEALGIDGKLLIEQSLAFLILVWLLSKFVYPVLIKAIDSRRELLDSSVAEAKKAEEAAASAEEKICDLLGQARKEADDIIAVAHKSALAASAEAEEKAKSRAERIVADAKVQLDREIVKARQLLRKETVQLVALATEKVIDEKVDSDKDIQLIETVVAKDNA